MSSSQIENRFLNHFTKVDISYHAELKCIICHFKNHLIFSTKFILVGVSLEHGSPRNTHIRNFSILFLSVIVNASLLNLYSLFPIRGNKMLTFWWKNNCHLKYFWLISGGMRISEVSFFLINSSPYFPLQINNNG